MEWAWEFIKKAVDGFADSLLRFVYSIGRSITLDAILSGPLFFIVVGNRWLVSFDNLLSELTSVIPRAALETALSRFPAPPGLRSRSLSADDAWNFTVLSIVLPSIGIVNGTLPLHVRFVNQFTARGKTLSFLLNPTVEKWLGILLRPFKITIMKILGVAWQVVAIVINFCAAIFGLILLGTFVESGKEDLLELCFQQRTPRKRMHTDDGKLIVRRVPGGSKP